MTFNNEFNGMTFQAITLNELKAVPGVMVNSLKFHFTQSDFDFLCSFKSGEPDWDLAPLEQIRHFPAVKWKLLNIKKMSAQKRKLASETLNKTMSYWLEH